MAAYSLLSSVNTVQVLSPTLVNPVLECTISTSPSLVIASLAISLDSTGLAANANPELTAYANAIEQIMADSRVIAGQGAQKIDANGLISDQVVFTVEYVSADARSTGITTEVEIPSASLNFEDGLIGATLLESVLAKIDAAYESLVSAAAG